MTPLWHPGGGSNPREGYAHFDKITFRMRKKLTAKQMQLLRNNAESVDQRIGRPIRGSDHAWLLTIVNPCQKALEFVARRSDVFCNYVEAALDIPTRDKASGMQLVDVFDRHFVQPHHHNSETNTQEFGSYTRGNKPGLRYVWYGDKPSKVSGQACLHVEARAHGLPAVRRIGIRDPRDLLTFDHVEFWRKRLNLFTIDHERLGRWHSNKLNKSRRQQPQTIQRGAFRYNVDAGLGRALFRAQAETPAFERYCAGIVPTDTEYEPQPTDHKGNPCRLIDRSVQRFVDVVGRGPFLRRLDILCYMRQRQLLNTTMLHVDANTPVKQSDKPGRTDKKTIRKRKSSLMHGGKDANG